jgi:transcriptional regulator with XRE-family HTH domain
MAKFRKMTDAQRKTPLEDYLDPTYLTYLRVSRGKTRPEMAELFGCGRFSYARYESGGVARYTLGIAKLRLLCNYLQPDVFELCTLLKYEPYEERITKRFRDACSKNGQTVSEVLKDFMEMYTKQVLVSPSHQ